MLETRGSWLFSGEETAFNKLHGVVGILSGAFINQAKVCSP